MKKAKLKISGMHCASCSANIERSLKKTPGVRSASVSLLLNRGTVEAEDSVSSEDLKKAVKRAGYEVRSVEFE